MITLPDNISNVFDKLYELDIFFVSTLQYGWWSRRKGQAGSRV